MTNQEIFELMDRFESSSLAHMKLSVDGFKIELEKGARVPQTAAPDDVAGAASRTDAAGMTAAGCVIPQAAGSSIPQAAGSSAIPQTAAGGAAAFGEGAKSGLFITAPMVGTYYAASAPQQSPFVMPGDRVYKGQTVCMMEAMKMISEIPAPCDCIIEEILKADGDLAAFGEPLFRYQPC